MIRKSKKMRERRSAVEGVEDAIDRDIAERTAGVYAPVASKPRDVVQEILRDFNALAYQINALRHRVDPGHVGMIKDLTWLEDSTLRLQRYFAEITDFESGGRHGP